MPQRMSAGVARAEPSCTHILLAMAVHEPITRVDVPGLRARCLAAVKRARRVGRPVLLGWTVALDSSWDPSAVAFASRADGEDLFCFEQPDRDGFALAGLGRVARLSGSGADRFASVARQWRELAGGAVADAPDGPPGAGLVALGGFAFAPDGGSAPHWAGYSAGDPVGPDGARAARG